MYWQSRFLCGCQVAEKILASNWHTEAFRNSFCIKNEQQSIAFIRISKQNRNIPPTMAYITPLTMSMAGGVWTVWEASSVSPPPAQLAASPHAPTTYKSTSSSIHDKSLCLHDYKSAPKTKAMSSTSPPPHTPSTIPVPDPSLMSAPSTVSAPSTMSTSPHALSTASLSPPAPPANTNITSSLVAHSTLSTMNPPGAQILNNNSICSETQNEVDCSCLYHF